MTRQEGGKSRNREWHFALATAFVAAAATGIELGFGVHLGEVLRFAGFELGYVILPGWMAYVALSANAGGWARQIALGAGLGYALECLAFAATGAAGVPGWFAAYPAAVAVLAGPVIWRRKKSGHAVFSFPSPPSLWSWALGLILVAALVYLALTFFVSTPLPRTTGAVCYYQDTVWDISCAAEAKYHWPITNPRVSGAPFYYYTFVFMHMAAASRITGLDLPVIVFRLYIASFFVVFTLQLYAAGCALGKDRRSGFLAVVVTLFLGSVQLWPFKSLPGAFMNGFFTVLYLSPTYMLGLLLFTPLIVETYDRIAAPDQRGSVGSWLVIGLLLAASGGAKATVLPVFAGGAGLYFGWRLLSHRTANWPALGAAVLGLVIFAVWNKLVFSHAGVPAVIHPFTSMARMPFTKWVRLAKRKTLLERFWKPILLTPVALAGMLGVRSITSAWVLFRRGPRRNSAQMLLLSFFFISLLPFLLLDEPGLGQYYFLYNGMLALSISAGCALSEMIEESACWAWPSRAAWFGIVGMVAVDSLLDTPLTHDKPVRAWLWSRDANYTCPAGSRGDLTNGLLAGLDWIRLHSSPADVLAVNNQYLDPEKKDPRYFYYSAFAERRVFLEGWNYSRLEDYAGRLGLNQRVFDQADPEALRLLFEKYGVRWLVVDKLHGSANPLLSKLAKLVYANPDVAIYSVSDGSGIISPPGTP